MQRFVANTLPRNDESSQAKGWIQGNKNWTRIGTHDQFSELSNMELKFESGLWVKTILNLGSEYPIERSNMWSIQIKTIQKFLQIHKKIKCHKQVSRLLQPHQRQKQNHKREKLFELPSTIPKNERKWIDIEPAESSLSLCVRDFKESNPSSSTLSKSTTRRSRSSSILEN